ncbi:MAG: VWA domain-containing protein [Rhodobacteraceae bacterium]|nr:VWA domain-containing protein [Paracoccaceae bacterium]
MTEELDRLRKALQGEAPAVDPARRDRTLAAALAAFDARQAETSQEIADRPRHTSDRPVGAGFLTGVREMLAQISTRPVLAATASVAALAVGLGVVLTRVPPATGPGPSPQVVAAPDEAPPAPAPEPSAVPGGGLSATADAPPAAAPPVVPVVVPEEAPATADATTAAAMPPAAAKAVPGTPGAVDGGVQPGPAPDSYAAATAAPPAAEADARAMAPAGSGLAAPAPAADAPGIGERLREALPADRSWQAAADTEAFPQAERNPVRIVAEEPVSTFSIDVDTASYAVIRSSLMAGQLPPPDAVRIEEMINYFPYSYPAPTDGDGPFRPTVTVVRTPWNEGTRLVHIGIQGRMPAIADRPPLNLVFLIDTSGSMDEPDRLPLLVQSFRLMLGQLRPEDQVAIVTYAGSAGLVLEPTPASDRARIEAALDNLHAGGSTAGQEGLQQAYAVAETMKSEGEVTRVILATDGDFNVGIADPEELKDYIAARRDTGIYLSVLGFGRGNLDDATIQALAQNGNGTAAYIDTLGEAQKVMVDQLTGALFPIADDVKIQMEFNPAVVAEYRLIGFETRALRREDFNNDRVDAGEIGAGVTMTAIYEVTPVGSPAVLSDALRYRTDEPVPADAEAARANELGFLKLRYKDPGSKRSRLVELAVPSEPQAAGDDVRFAVAVAGFGQLLTGAEYLGDWSWDDAIALASGARGEDPFGYRAEAVQLMRLAKSLSR